MYLCEESKCRRSKGFSLNITATLLPFDAVCAQRPAAGGAG